MADATLNIDNMTLLLLYGKIMDLEQFCILDQCKAGSLVRTMLIRVYKSSQPIRTDNDRRRSDVGTVSTGCGNRWPEQLSTYQAL